MVMDIRVNVACYKNVRKRLKLVMSEIWKTGTNFVLIVNENI